MHINDIDLNLLRLFDAVYRTRNVSRAAELLDLTQPAASQGLTRLRALIHDPLFMRAAGGVQPTPKAERLADAGAPGAGHAGAGAGRIGRLRAAAVRAAASAST